MGELREQIDEVDEQLVRLLDRRARLARGIGEIKRDRGLETYAPDRERMLMDRLEKLSEGDFPRRGLQAVFREIISCSISLEAQPEGCLPRPRNNFLPTRRRSVRLERASSWNLKPPLPRSSPGRARRGRARRGPGRELHGGRRNAHPGRVDEQSAQDLWRGLSPISQNLLAKSENLGGIETVCSHPMALAQAATWLRNELPGVKFEEVESTGEAARRAAGKPMWRRSGASSRRIRTT